MFCTKCGTQIPKDGQFCMFCGTPVSSTDTSDTAQKETVQDAQTASSFGAYYTQPYGADQPLAGQPKKKNAKKIIIASASIVLAVALAAVLLLTVFTQSEGWPFSGKTIQTRFVNDSIAVFTRAFGDINYGKMDEINNNPFSLSYAYNMEINQNGQQQTQTDMNYEFAYDEQTLANKTTVDTGSTTLLLIEDTLYIGFESEYFGQSYDYTTGIKFDAKTDLSKPMTLNERFMALFAGDEIDVDLIMLLELFINSISEDCFDKNNTRTTLRMDSSDISQMLKTFAEKLNEDKELNESLKNALEKLVGARIDVPSMIPLLNIAVSKSDIELIWTVRYDDAGLPKRVEISLEDSGSLVFDFAFQAQRDDNTRNIMMEISAPGGYQNFSFSIEAELIPKTDGLEFSGIMTANGVAMSMEGFEVWDGYDFSGNVQIDVPNQNINSKTSFNGTLSIGKPSVPVASDERFAIDKENAHIMDLSEIFSMFSIQGLMPSL